MFPSDINDLVDVILVDSNGYFIDMDITIMIVIFYFCFLIFVSYIFKFSFTEVSIRF